MGIGPGDPGLLAPRAKEALAQAEVVFGYRTYLGLVGDLLAGKEVAPSGMREEVARARAAVAQ